MPDKKPFRTIKRPATIGRLSLEDAAAAVIAVMVEDGEMTQARAELELRKIQRRERRIAGRRDPVV